MNQGKTNKQMRDSNNFVKLGYIGIIVLGIIILLTTCTGALSNKNEEYMTPHDYWLPHTQDTLTPQDALHVVEPDMIYYDTLDIDGDCGGSDEYQMWIGGDGDTIWE
jgi:hypothetical protein